MKISAVSYAEKMKATVFINWDIMIRQSTFTGEELDLMISKATHWETSPSALFSSSIKREPNGEPIEKAIVNREQLFLKRLEQLKKLKSGSEEYKAKVNNIKIQYNFILDNCSKVIEAMSSKAKTED